MGTRLELAGELLTLLRNPDIERILLTTTESNILIYRDPIDGTFVMGYVDPEIRIEDTIQTRITVDDIRTAPATITELLSILPDDGSIVDLGVASRDESVYTQDWDLSR